MLLPHKQRAAVNGYGIVVIASCGETIGRSPQVHISCERIKVELQVTCLINSSKDESTPGNIPPSSE